jgi:hypothetical protein
MEESSYTFSLPAIDPEVPLDLRRHECQVSEVEPPLANSPRYSACRR